MTDTDLESVMYDLDPEDTYNWLVDVYYNVPESRWFARPRLIAMAKRGLIAAAEWNPLLHPRGPDGRFIETGGWVRWLFNNIWHIGKVDNIDGKTGLIRVLPEGDKDYAAGSAIDFTPNDAKTKLYRAPAKKASLKLPNPKTGESPSKSFKKTAPGGGSNPGGKYKVEPAQFKSGKTKDIFKDRKGISAGYFGKVMNKYNGDFAPSGVDGDIVREFTTGHIYRNAGGTFVDVDNNPLEDESILQDSNTDRIVFGFPEDVDKAWDELRAYAKGISTGDEFFVKHHDNIDRTQNEALANWLYELAGVSVPDTYIGEDMHLFASKIVSGENNFNTIGNMLNDPDVMHQVRKDMIIDAWLGNWNVVGLGQENIIVADGVPYRIDAGGALLYRTNGSLKGSAFGKNVTENKTFKDANLNPSSAAVFGSITNEELFDGLDRLAALSPEQIHAVVEAVMGDGHPDLGNLLVARRANLLAQYDYDDPWDVAAEDLAIPEMPAVETKIDPVKGPNAMSLLDKVQAATKAQSQMQDIFDDMTFFQSVKPGELAVQPGHIVHRGWLKEVVSWTPSAGNDGIDVEVKNVHDGKNAFAFLPYTNEVRVSAVDLPISVIDGYVSDYEVLAEGAVASAVNSPGGLPGVVNASPPVPYLGMPFGVQALPQTSFKAAANNWATVATQMEQSAVKASEGAMYYLYDNTDQKVYKADKIHEGVYAEFLVASDTDGGEFYFPAAEKDDAHEWWIPSDDFTNQYLAAVWEKENNANTDPFDDPAVAASFDEYVESTYHKSTVEELDKKAVATNAASEAEDAMTPVGEDDQVENVISTTLMDNDKITLADLNEAIDGLSIESTAQQSLWSWLSKDYDQYGLTFKNWNEIKYALESVYGTTYTKDLHDGLLAIKNTPSSDVPDLNPDPSAPSTLSDASSADYSGGVIPGLSKKLTGDSKSYNFFDWNEDPENAVKHAKGFVGKTIYYPFQNGVADDPETGEKKFSWVNTHGGLYYVESYDEEARKLSLRDISGTSFFVMSHKDPSQSYGAQAQNKEFWVIDNISATDFKISKPPTLKKDGTIVSNGVQVGTWEKDPSYYWGNKWKFTVDPEHNIWGVPVSGVDTKKTDIKTAIGNMLIPSTPPVKPKTKSTAATKVKAAVETPPEAPKIDLNPGGNYSDGTEAKLGDWVKSTKGGGGFIGKIVSWPDQENYPGLVFAVDENGVQKAVNLKTQKKVDGPDAVDLSKLPSAYTDIKLKDGKTPSVGQKVTAGEPGKSQVSGIITNINTTQGWVYIQTPDGKKVSKTYSVVSVDAEPDHIWDVDTAVAAAAAATPTPAAVKKASPKKKTKGATYPGPDGFLISQDQSKKDAWLESNPNRKLTKDGYAPVLGMRVRNNKGEEAVITQIASEWDPNPNKIKLYNITQGKFTNASTNTVEVDHAAEGFGYDGEPLQKVNAVEIPGYTGNMPITEGWTIHRYKTQTYVNFDGSHRYVDAHTYFFTAPESPKAYVLTTNWGGDPQLQTAHVQNLFSNNTGASFEKIGIVGEADQKFMVKPFNNKTATNSIASFVDDDEDPSIAFADNNIEKTWGTGSVTYMPQAQPQVEETPAVETETPATPSAPSVSVASPKTTQKLSVLPDGPVPADPPEEEGAVDPLISPPQITKSGGKSLRDVPSILKGKTQSIFDAAKKMVGQRDEMGIGTGSTYAMGDSDYIEDMAVRMNVSVEGDQEYLDVQFRVREEMVDSLATRLLTTDKSAEKPKIQKGRWDSDPNNFVTDLSQGDKIAIHYDSYTKTNKPTLSNAQAPNAVVVGTPELIGESNGFPLYRVTLVTGDGETVEVDMEKRNQPSIAKFTWDPNYTKVLPQSNYGSVNPQIRSQASSDGWIKDGSGVGLPYQYGADNTDNTGKAKINAVGAETTAGNGQRLSRSLGNGAKVRVNLIHPDEPNSKSNEGYHDSADQEKRPNMDGQVAIRIPLSGQDLSDEEIQSIISQGMEAVGVPVDKQGPATEEQLRNYALQKFITQHLPKYEYKAQPISGPEDPRVQQALDNLSHQIKEQLGRDVTLDDIRIHTWDTGRVQVLMSPEVGKAISKRNGVKWYSHSGVQGETVSSVFAGPTTGVMSTDERWSLGIVTTGASSKTDMQNGAGDRVYMTGHSSSGGWYANNIILNGSMVAMSTEIYRNDSDNFGNRKKTNNFVTSGAGYEYMYKRMLESAQVSWYTVTEESSRQHVLKILRSKGVEKIANRDIEDVIVTTSWLKDLLEKNPDKFFDTGMDIYENDIPLTQVGAPAAPGVAA